MEDVSVKCIRGIEVSSEPDFSHFSQEIADGFYRPVYRLLYNALPSQGKLMELDADDFKDEIIDLYAKMSKSQQSALRKSCSVEIPRYDNIPYQKLIWIFVAEFPVFGLVLKHIHLKAEITLKVIALLVGEEVDSENFIRFKTEIDDLNRLAWVRRQTESESQSGVSNLGTISEMLLERALADLIDGIHFFKTNNPEIQSYGDFVLMCLPNNLWLSVKSNFARERLLASGYTTDILGVGFFTDYKEFTSKAKIRNFQRVGFLAMYLPDIPVSLKQQENKTNTYNQIFEFYSKNNREMPKNINGTDFLRPLSRLYGDIKSLLSETDVRHRTTLQF